MKTPREILLEQHRRAEPALDRIREEVLKVDPDSNRTRSSIFAQLFLIRFGVKLWLELVWPARRIWVGFGCAWLLIVALNIAGSDRTERTEAKLHPQPIGTLMAWGQQEKLIGDVLNPPAAPDADKPRSGASKPRSDRRLLLPIG